MEKMERRADESSEPRAQEMIGSLVEIPSPSRHERAIAAWIARCLERLGRGSVTQDESDNVIFEIGTPQAGKTLLFLTHTDTRDPGPVERVAWHSAVGPEGEECVFGLGSAAPKGSVAAMMLAATGLAEKADRLAGSAKFVFVVRDLLANHDGPRSARQFLEGADFALSAEPSGNDILLATRGILQLSVRFLGKPGHWGSPVPRENAIYAAAGFLVRLKEEPISGGAAFGVTGFNPIDLRATARPPLVAEEIVLDLDRRVLPGEDPHDFERYVEELLAASLGDNAGVTGEVRTKSLMFPFTGADECSEYSLLKRTVLEVCGAQPRRASAKFASNAAYLTSELGIPSLILGAGRIEDVGPDERVSIPEVVRTSHIYERFALSYLGAGG